MTRFSVMKFGAGACALALCLCLNAPAQAGWFSHGGSWGSHGRVYSSYGSSGGSYGSHGSWGSYGSHGSWGSSGGSHGSWGWRHHRRVHYSSYGSYGSHGSHGSCGSSGGYYTTYHGSHGSHGSYGSYTTSAVTATYAKAKTSSDSAMLTVTVPENAKVFVNGAATKSTGSERRYVSRGLKNGESYTYQVKVELTRDGETVEETKEVKLQTGQNARLAFDLDQDDVETTLTVKVPEDAKVTLSGNDTASTGDTRTFTTTNLRTGNVWQDYTVQVSVERNGQTMTKSQTIDLVAGDTKTLNFDFETEAVASR